MKIEKVNENQIRCTLTKQDLADRQINLRELAYGSEKAKGLFHDMIQQANYEFGFDVSDNPLMVEAIPLSSESLVLLITKVEYPEELDTRFSQFTEAGDEDLTKMFEFTTIDQVERLAHVLVNYYNGRNDLFKNEKKNRFYLVIHKDDHTPEEFNKVCNIICEYAQQKNYNPAVGAYFAEHGNKITGPQALQVFASL